jgi:hypothetical protein
VFNGTSQAKSAASFGYAMVRTSRLAARLLASADTKQLKKRSIGHVRALDHCLLYIRIPKGMHSLACWKKEAYFSHLSSDFPASKSNASGPTGAIW